MSGTVYTVASGKGGVGKTTTSVNLAVALWQEGNAVALVDADIGMANLAAVLNLDPDATLHDVLAGRATVEEALVEAQGGNLLVLPGDRDLRSFADADPRELRAAVDELAERCDYVIVDTGAGLSYEDVLPLGMAHGVLLVTTPDPAAFGDTRKTMEVADLLGAPIRGLVVTRAVEDTDSAAIANEIGAELLGTIPEDPAVMASTVAGNPLESHAPDSDAAAAYRDVAETLLAGDEAWLEAHPRDPAPSIDEVEAVAEPQADDLEADDGPEDADADESTGDASTAADDEGTMDVEAGEAWAAANDDPVGADETADIGDLVVEPGEADEGARGEETGASEDDEPTGVSRSELGSRREPASGADEDAPAGAGSTDDPAADAAPAPEPDESPTRAPPDAEQASSPGWAVEGDDEAGPDDGVDDAAPEDDANAGGDDAHDESEDDVAETGVDEGTEPPEGEDAAGADAEDADLKDEAPTDGADQPEAGDEPETPDDAEEDGEADGSAAEEGDAAAGGEDETEGGDDDGADEGLAEGADWADDPEATDRPGEDDEPADDEAEADEEEEKRGGLRGWLGRLF